MLEEPELNRNFWARETPITVSRLREFSSLLTSNVNNNDVMFQSVIVCTSWW